MDSIQPKTKELMTYYCGCHGNLVTIAMRFVADAYSHKGLHTKYGLNMTQDKKFLTYYCGCHGNLVTITTRLEADAYCPKEPPYQIWTQYDV